MADSSPAGEPGQRLAPPPTAAIPEGPGGSADRPAPPYVLLCCCPHPDPGKGFWVHTWPGVHTLPVANLPLQATTGRGVIGEGDKNMTTISAFLLRSFMVGGGGRFNGEIAS